MNPGFWYVYEYKNEKRLRNVGFLKISRKACGFDAWLNLRGLPVDKGDAIELNACVKKGGYFYLRPAASFTCRPRSVCAAVSVSEEAVSPKDESEAVCGFVFCAKGRVFGAFFEESGFGTEKIRDEMQCFPSGCAPVCENPPEETPAAESVREEKPQAEDPQNINAPPGPAVRKIRRPQLCELPKNFWPLANNGFLLHGCHNYHHLILIKEDNMLKLGVPGLYDKREAAAAEFFGFPVFSHSYTRFLSLTEDESDQRDNFGYWCRVLYTIPFIS